MASHRVPTASLRVQILLNSFEDDGPNRLVLGICRALAGRGDLRIRVAALARDGVLRDAFEALGCGPECLRWRRRGGFWRIARFADRMRADRTQVLHTHLLAPDLAGRAIRGRSGVRALASTCHGLHAAREKGRAAALLHDVVEGGTRGGVAVFTAVSAALRDEMIDAGYPARRVVAIPNGIDLGAFPFAEGPARTEARSRVAARFGIPPGARLLAAVGNLRPVKDHATAVRALARLAGDGIDGVLLVAGDGPELPALERLASALGVAERLLLPGRIDDGLVDLLKAADVFVQPSRAESFGLAVAEAMAAGAPIVATRVGGVPELVVDGRTGLLVPVGDDRAMAEAITRILGDRDLARRLAADARAHAERHADIRRTAQRTLRLWRRIGSAR